MFARDRLAAALLLGGAVVAWLAVSWLVTSVSPVGDATVQLVGALLLGAAASLTAWPLLWLLAFARHRVALRGQWATSGRRAALLGLVVSIFVVLRGLDALSPPLAIFVAAMAALTELAFTLRR